MKYPFYPNHFHPTNIVPNWHMFVVAPTLSMPLGILMEYNTMAPKYLSMAFVQTLLLVVFQFLYSTIALFFANAHSSFHLNEIILKNYKLVNISVTWDYPTSHTSTWRSNIIYSSSKSSSYSSLWMNVASSSPSFLRLNFSTSICSAKLTRD